VFIDENSIKINGISFGKYLLQVKFGYHKIWSKDSGRNLAGDNSGTLKGIYPKLTMQFRTLTGTELETLSPIFDSVTQSVTYYDPNKKTNITLSTYTGDWEVVNKTIIDAFNKNEGFSIAFISNKKRV